MDVPKMPTLQPPAPNNSFAVVQSESPQQPMTGQAMPFYPAEKAAQNLFVPTNSHDKKNDDCPSPLSPGTHGVDLDFLNAP